MFQRNETRPRLITNYSDDDNDDDNDHDVFTLLETPKRKTRTTTTAKWNEGSNKAASHAHAMRSRCEYSFFIRMTFAAMILVTLTILGAFFRERPFQPMAHLRTNITSYTATPKSYVTPNNKDTTTTTNNNNNSTEISDDAWKELLQHFRNAMIKPVNSSRRLGWIPLVISDSKMYLSSTHKARVSSNGRFNLFNSMMRHALSLNQSKALLRLDESVISSFPMVMNLEDVVRCGNNHFPRFSWCTTVDPHQCTTFAIPSYNVYRDAPNTTEDYTAFHDALESAYPWSSKKALAVWRGSATGHSANGWAAIPRARLVNASIYYPNLLDAAFVGANQLRSMHPEEEIKLRNHSRFTNRMKFYDFQKYRAIMDIDGNAWSARFGNLLRMNSVIVKVHPTYQNYFFRELKPWVHYIPVASNLSDLVEALRFAVSNETEPDVRKMVHTTNEWCRTRLTKERMAADILHMLESYLKLLGNNASRWREWADLVQVYDCNMTLVVP